MLENLERSMSQLVVPAEWQGAQDHGGHAGGGAPPQLVHLELPGECRGAAGRHGGC